MEPIEVEFLFDSAFRGDDRAKLLALRINT
jgi:hypothetical protein